MVPPPSELRDSVSDLSAAKESGHQEKRICVVWACGNSLKAGPVQVHDYICHDASSALKRFQ
ncbi:hypothetical protein PGTUg99_026832 [Puccinia graminis f. sp. tritici]|uniref:Uncharacterized protein n=1 Tax=Puccinia graminis f. sp. tritici TaxID=56615 RepID=A0A5B0R681_PUCGR|nr:hypothetical protein PGTUg99_000421 [Puccinia graminis f. sp. tritici]KAA1120859.1 hypothetical protein PGTUg99_026832 [Puccinia graminis f. sp. tritici]